MRPTLAPATPDLLFAPHNNGPRRRLHCAAGAAALLCMAQASTALAAPTPPSPANFSISSPSVVLSGGPDSTGTVNFTVTRSGNINSVAAVEYTTVQDGNAAPGIDYTPIPPTLLIFPSGTASLTVPVSVTEGIPAEKAETFGLQLSPGPANLIGPYITNFGTHCEQTGIAEADLNGDGLPDLAVACDSTITAVQVYTNTTSPPGSNPSFNGPVSLTNGASPTLSVAIADIDGDGKPDIVATGHNQTWVFLGDGMGNFSAAIPVASIGAYDGQSLAIGDFNGDGKPDIATADGSGDNTINIALNTTLAPGTPTFSAPVGVPTGNNFQLGTLGLAVGDLNGDGKPDIAAASFGGFGPPVVNGAITVLLNHTMTGAATASFYPAANFPLNHHEYSVAIDDLNGDGVPDLMTVSRDGTVTFLGNTTPSGATAPTFAGPVDFSTGGEPIAIALGDISGDGLLDVVVSNDGAGTAGFMLINNTAPGSAVPSFLPPVLTLIASGGSDSEGLAIGDINADGLLDVVIPSAFGGGGGSSGGFVTSFPSQSNPAVINTALGVATLIIPDASGATGSSGASGGASSGSAGTGSSSAPASGGGGAVDPGLLAAWLGLVLLGRARASRRRTR